MELEVSGCLVGRPRRVVSRDQATYSAAPMKPLVRTPLLSAVALASALGGPLLGQKAVPRFEEGQAQIVDAFKDPDGWIHEDLWVECEFDSDLDGKPDRVHVDVSRPRQTRTEGLKVPVIYQTSPYFNGVGALDKSYFWDPEQELGGPPPKRTPLPPVQERISRPLMSQSLIRTWVPRGFAVVHSASPGTGLSQGCPTIGGKNESLAPKAVIDWLNGRAVGYSSVDGDDVVEADWCTGKVGMIGTSFEGTLPIAAATTGVEGLECLIPVAPNTSYYHYYRSYGLVRHPGGYMGEDIDVLYDFVNSGKPEGRENCNCKVRDEVLMASQDRTTGDYNEFWAGRDYANQLENYRAPTFMAHGFNDWNVMPEHSYRIYMALKAKGIPVKCFYHQGGHGGDPPFELVNKWFSHYLYGVENDLWELPGAFIVREGKRANDPTPYADYPHPDARDVTLHPGGEGGAVGSLTLQAVAGSGRQSFVDNVDFPGKELAQAETSKHRLLFATPELRQPVHLSGRGSLRIRMACDKPAANLSVWVVSLPYTNSRRITDNIITRGWADPQNRGSLTESSPLTPGEFVEFSFELQPDDQVIPAGQKIGLMIFSSDRDFTLWPKPGAELTVDLAGTALTLPVVGGAESLQAAFGQ